MSRSFQYLKFRFNIFRVPALNILPFLGILLLLSFQNELLAQEDFSETKGYALLWEVTGPDLEKPSYLFGTMHVRDGRAFEFPDSVLIALDNCEALATEVHFDSLYTVLYGDLIEEQLLMGFYELDEEVEHESYSDLEESTEEDPLVNEERPRFNFSRKDVTTRRFDKLESFLSSGRKQEMQDVFLDAFLFRRAKNLGKDLHGLENIKEHFDLIDEDEQGVNTRSNIEILDSLSESELPRIKEMIQNPQEIRELLTNIYHNGDLSQVEEFSNTFFGESRKQEWLIDRNWDMLRSMQRIMPKQSLFAAVGCAHLPGKEGLLDLLTQHGYTVRRVVPNNSGVTERKMAEKIENKWVTFVNEESGIKVDVPVAPHDIDIMAGLKMHMVHDMIHDDAFVFYGLPCALSGIDPKDPDRYEKLMVRLEEEGRIAKITSRRKIFHQGRNGYEAEALFEREGLRFRGRIRAFTANQFMYLFMSMKNSEGTADRFFESVRFLKPIGATSDDEGFKTERQAAFKATMPGLYQTQELELPVDPSTPEFKIKLSQFMASDLASNTLRAVIKTDLAPGTFWDNDSTAFELILSEFDGEIKYADGHGQKFVLENGVVGYQPALIIEDRTMRALVRGYIRGPCYYLLLYQSPEPIFSKEDAARFFESVELLEFMPEKLINYDREELHTMLANEPVLSDNEDYYDGLEYALNDYFPNTNVSMSITKENLNKYVALDLQDTIYKNYTDENVFWLEEVERESVQTNSKGDKYLDMLVITKGASTLERRIIYYKNEAYYRFSYLISPELKDAEWLDELISKTVIDDLPNGLSNNERRELFFNDLMSGDQERFNEARSALYMMEYEEKDLEMMKKVLATDFVFGEEDETAIVHSNMLSQVAEVGGETAAGIVRDYFDSTEDPSARLDAYTILRNNGWTTLDMNTLIDEDIELDGYLFEFETLFMHEYKDSVQQFATRIPKYLKHHMGHHAARNALLETINEKCDTLEMNGFKVESIRDDMESCMRVAVDSIAFSYKENPDEHYRWWQHSYTLANAISVMAPLDDPEIKELVYDIPFQKYDLDPKAFLEYRIMRGDKVKKDEWQYAEDKHCGMYDLIAKVTKEGLTDVLPAEFRTKEKQAALAISCLISEDYGAVEVVETLRTERVIIEEEEREVILFLTRNEYEPENEYVVFVELIEAEAINEKSLWELYYDYSYTPVEDGDTEKAVQDLLSSYK